MPAATGATIVMARAARATGYMVGLMFEHYKRMKYAQASVQEEDDGQGLMMG